MNLSVLKAEIARQKTERSKTTLTWSIPIFVMDKELDAVSKSLIKLGWEVSAEKTSFIKRELIITHPSELTDDEIFTTGILVGQLSARSS